MANKPPTDKEKIALYRCAYCVSIGACPECHGLAGYNRVQRERDIMISRAETDGKAWERDDAIRADLLAALKATLHSLEIYCATHRPTSMGACCFNRKDARAAIAKASGESK